MKKTLRIVGIVVAIVAVVLLGILAYHMFHPTVSLKKGGGVGVELFVVQVEPTLEFVPGGVKDEIAEFMDWHGKIIYEVAMKTSRPRDIRAFAEVKDGKMTLRCEGTYTTEDGETAEYFREKTFDFVFELDEEFLK